MDVVKTNIEKIGGTIEMKSTYGRGSSFIIKIPLTLAIVSALIVECATERFAIPQISVVELVRAAADSEHTIERINGTPVLRLRNRLLPLVSLQRLLRLDGPAHDDTETFIVVTQVGTYTFGIIVDRVFDTEEIVVKPVAPILRHIEMFSGNTILGDGSVIMILDPNGIAAASSGEMAVGDAAATDTAVAHATRQDDKIALLLFRAGGVSPKAVPLAGRPTGRRRPQRRGAQQRHAGGPVPRQADAAGADRQRLGDEARRPPAGPGVRRRRPLHGLDRGRDRRHRRGPPAGRAGRRPAGHDGQRDHRGKGDRPDRRRLLPDPGLQGLVRPRPGTPTRRRRPTRCFWSTTARSSATC